MTTRSKIFLASGILIGGLLLYRKDIQQVGEGLLADPNIAAFLMTIRSGESTTGPEAYRMVYGSSLVQDLSDHPYFTGEFEGAELPDAWCAAAGFDPGCITTASGAYQITATNWRWLKPLLALPDFSKPSQDKAAIEFLRQQNAIDDILNGRITSAMQKVNDVWASVPGSNYGQPIYTNWLGTFENFGGTIYA